MKRIVLLWAMLTATVAMTAQEFWLGADISGTSSLEAFGQQLYNAQGNVVR